MCEVNEDNLFTHWDNDDDEFLEATQLLTVNTNDDIPPPTKEHLDVLHKIFGHKEFRPMQWKIIDSILNKQNDTCAIMATGYGKSLCFQYPAVFTNGITLVISPLISLMQDQVLSMKMMSISACLLGSANNHKDATMREIFKGKYRIIYMSPELACGESASLNLIAANVKISLIAIDEAHCVSTWGHGFRIHYRELGKLKQMFPDVPILAMTATATAIVQKDIVKTLNLRNAHLWCSGFDRPNLHFTVKFKGRRGFFNDIKHLLQNVDGKLSFPGSTIIYCLARRKTEEIYADLLSRGIECLYYHAGMKLEQRKQNHEDFVRDKVKCIVATIAFGMGIDKPDVRTIIHYGASRDVESYYQEIGRAGRDGARANCILYYCPEDFDFHCFWIEVNPCSDEIMSMKYDNLRKVKQFLTTRSCRREFILNYFGDQCKEKPINCCDNCDEEHRNSIENYDFTLDAKMFLQALKDIDNNNNVRLEEIVLLLQGSRSNKLNGLTKSHGWWKAVCSMLENLGLVGKKVNCEPETGTNFYSYYITSKGDVFLDLEGVKLNPKMDDELKKLILANAKRERLDLTQTTESQDVVDSNKANNDLYKLLLDKRTSMANEFDCMPYMIASNEVLLSIAERKPQNIFDFGANKYAGFNEIKVKMFAQQLIDVVCEFCNVRPVRTEPKSVCAYLNECPIPELSPPLYTNSPEELTKISKVDKQTQNNFDVFKRKHSKNEDPTKNVSASEENENELVFDDLGTDDVDLNSLVDIAEHNSSLEPISKRRRSSSQ